MNLIFKKKYLSEKQKPAKSFKPLVNWKQKEVRRSTSAANKHTDIVGQIRQEALFSHNNCTERFVASANQQMASRFLSANTKDHCRFFESLNATMPQ